MKAGNKYLTRDKETIVEVIGFNKRGDTQIEVKTVEGNYKKGEGIWTIQKSHLLKKYKGIIQTIIK